LNARALPRVINIYSMTCKNNTYKVSGGTQYHINHYFNINASFIEGKILQFASIRGTYVSSIQGKSFSFQKEQYNI
jgi:hypothetical protein